uniref:Uncharacterized protein n=1 Tax=Oryza punctata TaxID=4537 RepID=A0A0E0MI63_ORYPU
MEAEQKRQADNRYRRSMHLRMTPWIEAWSQALNDTDIAGKLVREAKTLWEKLRDGIAGTNQEVMAAVDSLRRKGKRIMRLASCRHSSDVYTTATSRRTFEKMPERPSTSSRPSTSARPSASARRSTDGRAAVRSTSVREAPTIPTIPEITQMSERLGGFGPTQEGTRIVRPVPQMPHARPHMIPQMTPDVPTSYWQGGFAPFAGTSQGIPTIPRVDAEFIGQGGFTSLGGQSPLTSNFASLIDYLFPIINRVYSVGSTACTYIWHQTHGKDNPLITVARRLVLEYRVIWTCCNKVIGYLVNIPPIVMKFHICKHRQQGLGLTLHRTATCPASVEGRHRYPMSFGLRKLMMRCR